MKRLTTFHLDYQPEYVGPAKVALATWTSDTEGQIFLTPDCMGPTEFNTQIDRLIGELEEIRRRAAAGFRLQPKHVFAPRR